MLSPIEILADRTVKCVICQETWRSLLGAITHEHFQPESKEENS